jgi:hypothetical protein
LLDLLLFAVQGHFEQSAFQTRVFFLGLDQHENRLGRVLLLPNSILIKENDILKPRSPVILAKQAESKQSPKGVKGKSQRGILGRRSGHLRAGRGTDAREEELGEGDELDANWVEDG